MVFQKDSSNKKREDNFDLTLLGEKMAHELSMEDTAAVPVSLGPVSHALYHHLYALFILHEPPPPG